MGRHPSGVKTGSVTGCSLPSPQSAKIAALPLRIAQSTNIR